MTKRFETGLVVGKFCPLHLGHQLVIDEAFRQSERVVIITYTNPELGYSPSTRERWLKELYPEATVIAVEAEKAPANDADEVVHRNFCAWLCETQAYVLPDAVFTSESYGDGFAKHLSRRWLKDVKHVSVDAKRFIHPISGTALRADAKLWRKFVHPFVRLTTTKRIVLLGGESSGKTTLARAVYQRYGYPWIPEFGRWWCENIGGVANLKYEHMLHIGQMQVEHEERILRTSTAPWMVCDTSPLTTKFYSEQLFGKVDPELDKLGDRHYDIPIILGLQEWIQDGDRMSPQFSRQQEEWYLRYYEERGIWCHWIRGGTVQERVERIHAIIYDWDKLDEV